MLQPCCGQFWKQLVKWDEALQRALQGWCPPAGQGLWGMGRVRSTGNPPALPVCQGWMGSSRRWVLPWLSPQESHQHVMLTQGFLYHRRDPLSLVLKNNSGIIPVPPALHAHQLCSPWKSSAGAYPKRNPKAASSFVPGVLFQLSSEVGTGASRRQGTHGGTCPSRQQKHLKSCVQFSLQERC